MFLLDMFTACEKILRYTENLRYFDEFQRDEKTIDAVIRNIEVLGEAVKNISAEFRAKYPEVEWSMIARTRDKLIHFYFGIEPEILWRVVRHNVPDLKRKLMDILEREGWQKESSFRVFLGFLKEGLCDA